MKRNVRIRFSDLNWKVLTLLVVMMVITPVDDVVLFPIGQMLDPVEILINVVLSYVLGKGAMKRAVQREGAASPPLADPKDPRSGGRESA